MAVSDVVSVLWSGTPGKAWGCAIDSESWKNADGAVPPGSAQPVAFRSTAVPGGPDVWLSRRTGEGTGDAVGRAEDPAIVVTRELPGCAELLCRPVQLVMAAMTAPRIVRRRVLGLVVFTCRGNPGVDLLECACAYGQTGRRAVAVIERKCHGRCIDSGQT